MTQPARSMIESSVAWATPFIANHHWSLIGATVLIALALVVHGVLVVIHRHRKGEECRTKQESNNSSSNINITRDKTQEKTQENEKGDQSKKQGAYGKVPTHKHGIVDQLSRPTEVIAALTLKLGGGGVLTAKNQKLVDGFLSKDSYECPEVHSLEHQSYTNSSSSSSSSSSLYEDGLFCDAMLHKVSRSFAGVIAQLPNTPQLPLRVSVGVFYLVLRALDTVEDDMDLNKFEPFVTEGDKQQNKDEPRLAAKVRLLCDFHLRFRPDADKAENENKDLTQSHHVHQHLPHQQQQQQQDLRNSEIGEADEAALLKNIDRLQNLFNALPPCAQQVIGDITDEMGHGMAEFIARDLREGTRDGKDFDRYCHVVAGTVGDGLSRLWAAFGVESASLIQRKDLWDNMGLFLQRTNIIRDVFEDYVDGRAFWPASVWKLYAPTNATSPEDSSPTLKGLLMKEAPLQSKLDCLNHMIADALELVPSSLEYLNQLTHPAVIRFCAVPQVMAIATLATCYDNPLVFTGVVKIRKGLAAQMLMDCCASTNNVDELRLGYQRWFSMMANQILARIPRNHHGHYSHFSHYSHHSNDRPLTRDTSTVQGSEVSYERVRAACVEITKLTDRSGSSTARTASETIATCFRAINWCAGAAFTCASLYFMRRNTQETDTGGAVVGNVIPRMTAHNHNAIFDVVLVSVGFISLAILLAFAGLPFSLGNLESSQISKVSSPSASSKLQAHQVQGDSDACHAKKSL